MNALARAGWLLCAAFFGVLTASLLHLNYVGLVPPTLLAVLALTALLRPRLALALLMLLIPVTGVMASARWNGALQWPEALVCAAVTGLGANAAWQPRRLIAALSAPALVFGTVVAASIIASLGVVAMKLGPAFTEALWTHFTREHFVDVRSFPAIHAGLRLIEGVLLFVLAARLALDTQSLGRVIAGAVMGAAVAGYMNIARLLEAAARGDAFWSSLVDLVGRLRWNVHYGDFNAAGSYFVMALLFAVGLTLSTRRLQHLYWALCSAIVAVALWLTSSRTAFLAGAVAAPAALVLPHLATGRLRLVRAVSIGLVALVLLGGLAVALPRRDGQVSPMTAADVRLGMAQTGVRMLATYPAFGVGVGQFTNRAVDFTSPELIAKFPPAVHENAHNNFIQIAAELGLAGGLSFIWLIVAGLVRLFRMADTGSRLVTAGIVAFVLTLMAGHPLLVPEPAFVFWTAFGALGGSTAAEAPRARTRLWAGALCLIILAALPWRMQSMLRDADLEHVGIGVSSVFLTSPDGIRYREAKGRATLFVPVGAFKVSVNPRTTVPVRLELRLDGRVADVVSLAPGAWNDISIPARTERASARYARLDLRVLDEDGTAIWITKVQPLN